VERNDSQLLQLTRAHARGGDPYGPEQRLERAGALIAQRPQFHAVVTDPWQTMYSSIWSA